MYPTLFDTIDLSAIFLATFLVVVLPMRPYMNALVRRGRVVDDVHKPKGAKVPSPAGPLLIFGLLVGEGIVYLLYHSDLPVVLAAVVAIAGAIGLADDLFVLGGRVKPLLLILASAPILLSQILLGGVYSARLYFPIFSATGEHFTIYSILILASLPVVSNAYNMMDAFNGEISGFTFLTSMAVVFGIALRSYDQTSYSLTHLAVALPLAASSLAFYYFNRYPARVFDGDSGSLTFGAMYAALAVTGGVEFAAVVAIVPAILNSFYILSSVRGFIERRRMRARPTYLTEDGLLHASDDPDSPTTLVRMLLLEGPLSEKAIVRLILTLTAFACLLSGITSVLTWVIS